MELEQLRALIAIVDAGSFLGASKGLGLTRSRLRTHIKTLEDELGIQLLTRNPAGVDLTEAGEHFVRRARDLLRDADELRRAASGAELSNLGELRLCFPTGVPPITIRLLLSAIRSEYPDLTLRLLTHPDPIGQMDRSVDVIVHFGDALAAGSFRTFVIRTFALRLMASAKYLDDHGRPQTIGDLKDHRLLLWLMGDASHGGLLLPGADHFTWSSWFSSSDCYVVRSAAADHHGIALLPDALAGEAGWPGPPLELVLPEEVVYEKTVRVLLPENKADTARVRAVAAVLRTLGKWVAERPTGG